MIKGRTILFVGLLYLGGTTGLQAQALTAEDILKQIDENLTSENQVMTSSMVVHGRRATRTIVSKSWVVGTEKSFTEYLSPPREAGTKMLKVGDELQDLLLPPRQFLIALIFLSPTDRVEITFYHPLR